MNHIVHAKVAHYIRHRMPELSDGQARDAAMHAMDEIRRDLIGDMKPGDYQIRDKGDSLADLHDLIAARL